MKAKKKTGFWKPILGSWMIVVIVFLCNLIVGKSFESWDIHIPIPGFPIHIDPVSRWWDLLIFPAQIFLIYFGIKLVDKIKSDAGALSIAITVVMNVFAAFVGIFIGFFPAIILAALFSLIISAIVSGIVFIVKPKGGD